MRLRTKKVLARLTLTGGTLLSLTALVLTTSLAADARAAAQSMIVATAMMLGPVMIAAKCHEVLSRKEEEQHAWTRRQPWDEGYGE